MKKDNRWDTLKNKIWILALSNLKIISTLFEHIELRDSSSLRQIQFFFLCWARVNVLLNFNRLDVILVAMLRFAQIWATISI